MIRIRGPVHIRLETRHESHDIYRRKNSCDIKRYLGEVKWFMHVVLRRTNVLGFHWKGDQTCEGVLSEVDRLK